MAASSWRWPITAVALLALTGHAAQAGGIQLDAPRGGWTTGQSSSFMQEVHYPAARVNLRAGTAVNSQIRGQIKAARKDGMGATTPSTLVVNGVPMPLESDETGHFERPYSFASGSNSVEVKSADRQDTRRVQFMDQGGGSRARLRVVLNWDTPATDLDLHVISPSGQHCFYANRVIQGGGALDVDVTTGFGPEIFATARPERGVWQVYVNFYGGSAGALTTAQVTVITGEGTPAETRRIQRIPMHASGDLQRVASFSVL